MNGESPWQLFETGYSNRIQPPSLAMSGGPEGRMKENRTGNRYL